MKLNPAVKRMVGAAATTVPQTIADSLLKVAALAPPAFKTRSFERLCTRMSQARAYRGRLIETNFGIVSSFRCRIPVEKTHYVFGRPENDVAERGTLRLVSELAKDCRHFLDVGAHEGIYTFAVAAEGMGTISLHWFEPDPALSVRLSRNLQRNHVTAHGNPVAASDANGQATFFQNLTSDLSGSLNTLFQKWHCTKRETVKIIRLSDYFLEHGVSRAIVKVDVEGTGAQVWSGLARCFRDVCYLVIELLAPEIEERLAERIIRQTGWHAYHVRDFELIESTTGEFTYTEPFWNWLFCDLGPSALRHRLSATQFRVVPAV